MNFFCYLVFILNLFLFAYIKCDEIVDGLNFNSSACGQRPFCGKFPVVNFLSIKSLLLVN